MDKFSYISNVEGAVIEDLYNSYLKAENSVDESWKKFFEGFDFAKTNFEIDGAIPDNVQKEFKVLSETGLRRCFQDFLRAYDDKLLKEERNVV